MKMADVIDSVTHHDKSVESQSEGESRIFRRINPSAFEYVRMYEPARKELNPSGLFAYAASFSAADETVDVQLESGFHERKKSGS